MKYFSHIKGVLALIKSGNRPRWSFDEKTGFDLCGDETRHLEIATVCYYSCPVLFFLLISLAKTKSLSRNETIGKWNARRSGNGTARRGRNSHFRNILSTHFYSVLLRDFIKRIWQRGLMKLINGKLLSAFLAVKRRSCGDISFIRVILGTFQSILCRTIICSWCNFYFNTL